MSLLHRWHALSPTVRAAAVRSARERAGIPDSRQRAAWQTRNQHVVIAILAEAAADREQPWPHTLLSDFARYWRDGVRTAYEGPAGGLRRRTTTAVLAAAVSGEQEYVDAAADGLMLLCEQTTWCWAAHESFAAARDEVVADPAEPYLDLGAAETVEILAWADLVLGPVLDERVPGLRRRMRAEARTRVLRPFLDDRRWHWLGLDGHLHNWNPWIHGHVLAAALFLETDEQLQSEVVDLVVDGLDRYLAALPDDGGCDEGYAYWWNGPARLAAALELLDRVTDGEFAPWTCTPLAELARYPQRMALGDGWYVNVGDGPARPSTEQPWHDLHRWGRRIADAGVMAQAAAYRNQPLSAENGLGRAVVGLFDDTWWSAEPGPLPLPASSWLPDVELLVARGNGLTLAVKGGHNAENHNHNDIGSAIVAVDATPVLIDLGQPTYTAISFSERRYEQWVVRSEWHNVPVVDGHEQSPGPQWRATGLAVRQDAADSLAVDLSRAYPSGEVRRVATLDRDAREVRIVDEWGDGTRLAEHFVIAGEPAVHEAGALVIETLGGATARLAWDPALGPGELERREVDDDLLEDVWGPVVHRLILDAGPDRQRFELTVTRLEESVRD
ncbi:heparinase II/III-like protein [Kribbella amoyensis]|uniref:Heparinase II/III-like protein n=1 Tax=Kribbella amoyensis TaxID=996641 RepID=A0A561BTP9_9ACTN|nr:heparinase II/III family protein [Kribbella amoyensis]TWD82209.1 heparinase II/III-like protein [Kribbella amoyensis]